MLTLKCRAENSCGGIKKLEYGEVIVGEAVEYLSRGYRDGEICPDFIDRDVPGVPQIDIGWIRCCHYLITLLKQGVKAHKQILLGSHWPSEMAKYLTKQANFEQQPGDQQAIAVFSNLLELINYS